MEKSLAHCCNSLYYRVCITEYGGCFSVDGGTDLLHLKQHVTEECHCNEGQNLVALLQTQRAVPHPSGAGATLEERGQSEARVQLRHISKYDLYTGTLSDPHLAHLEY